MGIKMDRRTFLKTLAVAGAAFTLKVKDGMEVFAQTLGSQSADLVAVLGGEPAAMFNRAISEMGGMSRFVKKGQSVVVKPNIGWDKVPELAANTNPQLVGEIVKQCIAAGAKEVIVFDNTCDEWRKCYENSGIEAAAKAAGAKVVPANLKTYYKQVNLPRGKKLKSTQVFNAVLDCDVWINVPVLKHHSGTNLTIAMKNLMGIIWNRRSFHISDLQQCVADLCTLHKKPVLNVVDAYRVLQRNGPRGRTVEDAVLSKALFVSQDIVAVDTAAAKFFDQIRNMPLDHVKHISHGEALKLGTTDIDSLNVKRIRM